MDGLSKEQQEFVRDIMKEHSFEQRQAAERELKRQAKRDRNRKKYGHVPGEDIITFAWKEIMSFIKA